MTDFRIPAHPQPGIYETTVAIVTIDGQESLVDSAKIDDIRHRPRLEFVPFDPARAKVRMSQWRTRMVNGDVQVVKSSVTPE